MIPVLRRLRQEHHKSKASPAYTGKLPPQSKPKQKFKTVIRERKSDIDLRSESVP